MTVAVSRAKGAGAEAVICASTGNTAASAAAYAARAGMRGAVIVPEGKIAIGKLAQALMHGARVIALRGNFDQALEIVRELADRTRSSSSTRSTRTGSRARRRRRSRSSRSSARRPTRSRSRSATPATSPPGGAASTELATAPLLYGFQAEGAAPLVHGAPVAEPETVASAIRIGNPARWEEAMAAFTARAAGSRRSPTSRSSTPTGCSPRARASSASRPRPRRSPASSPTGCRRPARRAAADRRLRAHRPRPQGSGHGAREGARRGRLRPRSGGGRARRLRLSRMALQPVPSVRDSQMGLFDWILSGGSRSRCWLRPLPLSRPPAGAASSAAVRPPSSTGITVYDRELRIRFAAGPVLGRSAGQPAEIEGKRLGD